MASSQLQPIDVHASLDANATDKHTDKDGDLDATLEESRMLTEAESIPAERSILYMEIANAFATGKRGAYLDSKQIRIVPLMMPMLLEELRERTIKDVCVEFIEELAGPAPGGGAKRNFRIEKAILLLLGAELSEAERACIATLPIRFQKIQAFLCLGHKGEYKIIIDEMGYVRFPEIANLEYNKKWTFSKGISESRPGLRDKLNLLAALSVESSIFKRLLVSINTNFDELFKIPALRIALNMSARTALSAILSLIHYAHAPLLRWMVKHLEVVVTYHDYWYFPSEKEHDELLKHLESHEGANDEQEKNRLEMGAALKTDASGTVGGVVDSNDLNLATQRSRETLSHIACMLLSILPLKKGSEDLGKQVKNRCGAWLQSKANGKLYDSLIQAVFPKETMMKIQQCLSSRFSTTITSCIYQLIQLSVSTDPSDKRIYDEASPIYNAYIYQMSVLYKYYQASTLWFARSFVQAVSCAAENAIKLSTGENCGNLPDIITLLNAATTPRDKFVTLFPDIGQEYDLFVTIRDNVEKDPYFFMVRRTKDTTQANYPGIAMLGVVYWSKKKAIIKERMLQARRLTGSTVERIYSSHEAYNMKPILARAERVLGYHCYSEYHGCAENIA